MQTSLFLSGQDFFKERKLFKEDDKNSLHKPLQIEPTFPYAMHSPEIVLHVQEMEKILRKCIPAEFFQKDEFNFQEKILQGLPFLAWNKPESSPGCIESIILCQASKEERIEMHLEAIFRDRLIQDKSISILSLQSLFFYWDLFPGKSFLILRMKGLIENGKDLSKALSYLPAFSTQIASSLKNRQSLESFFPQRALFENIKHTQIHQQLIFLLEKLPHLFTSDLLIEMGRFFSLCPKSFLEPRPVRLVTKILAFHCLIRVNLLRFLSLYPEKKHIEVRYLRTTLSFHFGSKPVLGLALGIAPLDGHELFEESHIQQAVQCLLPGTNTVQGSFYIYQGPKDPICTLYIEIEKKDGSKFSALEVCLLKRELENELKRRIEKLVPSIFMARNEEETMRNILILSRELKQLSDPPQVMISIETQTPSEIIFTVILVRVLKEDELPLIKYFEPLKEKALFVPDRVQQAGFLRKNTPKEVNVFHLRLPKTPELLRADYSVNFYLARNKAAAVLSDAIGSFRDYNGGMILKQGELFYKLQESFPIITQKHPELLENFFFSLSPIETQATLPLTSLEILFQLFLEAQKTDLPHKENFFLKFEEKKRQLFTMIRVQNASFKEELHATLSRYELCSKFLIQNSVLLQGSLYIGIIFPQIDEKKHHTFIKAIHEALKTWKGRLQNQQLIKLSFLELPQSFDPRLAGDGSSYTIIKMLFEGLTRLDAKGIPSLAIAQSVEISKDQKMYLFRLRKCHWSDGSKVTAKDFEYAWRSILSPDFYTPFAPLFYPIKNARLAKDRLCPMDQIGVIALDNLTLSVESEHPTLEFLELTAHPLFSPIHHIVDKTHSNWSFEGSKNFVCNGPFSMKKITTPSHYKLSKNLLYWDKDQVQIQQILLSKDTGLVANEMFKNEEIHWLGKPMRPWEPILHNNTDPLFSSAPINNYWCVFNTEKPPFHNAYLRKAFNLAIDKNDLTDYLSNGYLPASTPLSLSHTMNYEEKRTRADEGKALFFFEKALEELGLSRSTFPLVTFNFINTPLKEKMAQYLIQRWQKLFSIPCRSEGFYSNILFTKLLKGDFFMAGLSWKALIDNPCYTLNIFKQKNLDMNFAKWSHPEYQSLLELAQNELDLVKKITFLSAAERILIEEAPVFSLFYEREYNKKNPNLHNVVYLKNTGFIDFKCAYVKKQNTQTFYPKGQ